MKNIIDQHDIILNEYNRQKLLAAEKRDKGEIEDAEKIEFYADGIAYAFAQIFNKSIRDSKPVLS